jgi:hypothetical protein
VLALPRLLLLLVLILLLLLFALKKGLRARTVQVAAAADLVGAAEAVAATRRPLQVLGGHVAAASIG